MTRGQLPANPFRHLPSFVSVNVRTFVSIPRPGVLPDQDRESTTPFTLLVLGSCDS